MLSCTPVDNVVRAELGHWRREVGASVLKPKPYWLYIVLVDSRPHAKVTPQIVSIDGVIVPCDICTL